MQNATKVTVSTFGAVAGLAGIEHGIGEILQGNVAPDGIMIMSWPESEAFRILAGEPAMTIVPNLLASGILTILVSLIFVVWATMFVQRQHGGLVLMLLSLVLLLVGGGFGPPLLGIILGAAATRIHVPLPWFSSDTRRILAALWPWSFGTGVIAWLLLFPGSILFERFVGLSNPDLVVSTLILSAFGLLLLTIITGFAYDVERQAEVRLRPVMSG